MAEWKKTEKRIPFLQWAGKWCRATGTQLCGKEWEDKPNEAGTVSHLSIRVLDYGGGFNAAERSVTLYAGAVAEVCGYIPHGFRRGHAARFVKGGDIMVS